MDGDGDGGDVEVVIEAPVPQRDQGEWVVELDGKHLGAVGDPGVRGVPTERPERKDTRPDPAGAPPEPGD